MNNKKEQQECRHQNIKWYHHGGVLVCTDCKVLIEDDPKEQEVKTLQECKDEVARRYSHGNWNIMLAHIQNYLSVIDKACDEAAELYASQFKSQSTQEWISVNDRLPETEGEYLCGKWYRYGKVFIQAVYEFKFYRMCDTGELVVRDGETGVFQDGLAYGQDVTHWMPLPESPK